MTHAAVTTRFDSGGGGGGGGSGGGGDCWEGEHEGKGSTILCAYQ